MISFLSQKIRKYEEEILNHLLELVKPSLREKLKKQINAINKVQRINDDEVNFYRMKWGKPTFSSSLKLELEVEELRIAMFKFKNSSSSIKVNIWVVNGFLFSLEFDSSAKSFFSDQYQIIEKEIYI